MISSLLKATLAVALTPMALTADLLTLGGTLTDRKDSYTEEMLAQAHKHLTIALSHNDKES
ncbi:MAG TPA: hypothetical protein PLU46_00125 [Thiotrichales bacterium]|nr:hypothetical protein [Thiotrichales bacterium]